MSPMNHGSPQQDSGVRLILFGLLLHPGHAKYIGVRVIPQYSECGSPPQLLKIKFFFSTPDCKYHQFLNINASGLLQVLVKY